MDWLHWKSCIWTWTKFYRFRQEALQSSGLSIWFLCRKICCLPLNQEPSQDCTVSANCCYSTMESLQFEVESSEIWYPHTHWIWQTTACPVFTREHSMDWGHYSVSTWIGTKFLSLSQEPSLGSSLSLFFSSGTISSHPWSLGCSQDSVSWKLFTLTTTQYTALREELWLTCTHSEISSWRITNWELWAQKLSSANPDHSTLTWRHCSGTAAPSAGWSMRSSMELYPGVMGFHPNVRMSETGVFCSVGIQVSHTELAWVAK